MQQLKQKCQVVMLPQSREVDWNRNDILSHVYGLSVKKGKLELANDNASGGIPHKYWKPQYLYLVLDEEIKNEDWAISVKAELFKAQKGLNEFDPIYGDRKVVASTDKNLGLLLISESFIQSYVEKQGDISHVSILVTSTWDSTDRDPKTPMIELNKPILDAAGCIIIHQVKDTFTLEEVRKAFDEGIIFGTDPNSDNDDGKEFDNFINSL